MDIYHRSSTNEHLFLVVHDGRFLSTANSFHLGATFWTRSLFMFRSAAHTVVFQRIITEG